MQLHKIISTWLQNTQAGLNKIISTCANRKTKITQQTLSTHPAAITVLSAESAIFRADRHAFFVLLVGYQILVVTNIFIKLLFPHSESENW